ncbi:Pro-Pol polyprotein [Echinococcus granulosus]|uniref:Pro-Pol polyprotein n=1 Tax=Echinococcus granulosus TaxID=6210 RepID=W6UN43_ECHGR|nr:Pro-Pol polyprotein [Echinococcus granulosus]EUB59592.1 Pro-Pol polyprotein [Echinococcus granulosus]
MKRATYSNADAVSETSTGKNRNRLKKDAVYQLKHPYGVREASYILIEPGDPTTATGTALRGLISQRLHHSNLCPQAFQDRDGGNRHILVVVDFFTKMVDAESMKAQDAKMTASILFNRQICQHEVPEMVHTNQGANFENQLFTKLCKTYRISKTRITPAHPQDNGQVGESNRTLMGLLEVFAKDMPPQEGFVP